MLNLFFYLNYYKIEKYFLKDTKAIKFRWLKQAFTLIKQKQIHEELFRKRIPQFYSNGSEIQLGQTTFK